MSGPKSEGDLPPETNIWIDGNATYCAIGTGNKIYPPGLLPDRFPPPPDPPQVPGWVVDREQVDEVVDLICPRGRWWVLKRRKPVRGTTVGLTTAMHGAGGFGKTTLAELVRADRRVRSAFRKRVYRVTVGRDIRSREAIAAKAHEVAQMFDRAVVAPHPDRPGEPLAAVLKQAGPVLLVIDDVWDADQLAPFLVGAPECVRVVTTRRPSALPDGHRPVLVDRMSPDQAQALLTQNNVTLPQTELSGLVSATGRWALLLRLAHQHLARQISTGADPGAAARRLLEQLRAQGPADLDREEDRSRSVRASIDASTSLLPPNGDQRFLELGIFAEDEAVPISLVAELWAATGKLTEEETRTLCANMADLSLLTLDCTVPGGALSLHDVIRDHLRATLNSKLAQLNKAILDALEEKHLRTDPVTGAKVPAWWQIQDGYLSEYLISHFLDAERISEAETLAGDLRWVRARLHQRGPAAPAADLTRIPTATAARLASDLTRAAHILTPTSPVHALDAVLDSRLGALPHWREQPPVAAKSNARLTNRWDPPDLPSSAVHRILVGHNASVSGVAWSLDGTRLATASSDHTARIWDPTTGRETHALSHSNNISTIAWIPDGTRLATTSKSDAHIWDPATGTETHTLTGHSNTVLAVAWSPDGTRLATASSDHTARIWDPTTGREIRVLSHSNNVYAAAWSPDGTRLATTSDDHTARTWDPTTGTVLHTLTGHSKTIYTVAWSPDSARLAAMSVNNLHIWDPATGWEIRILNDTFAATSAVAWSPDSTRITTVSRNDAHIWDPATGTVLHTLTGHSNTVLAVAWSPDGSRLATASSDHAVRIWNPTSEVENQVHRPGDPPAAKKAQSPETGVWDHTARIWGPATHEALNRLAYDANHADDVVAVRWSPDGHRLATAFEDDTISIWHAATGVLLRTLIGHTSEVTAIAWSPDGTRLATSSWDHTVRIWDPTTGTAIHTLSRHADWAQAVAWSPDGTRLATASSDHTARIWNPTTGTAIHTLTGHTLTVTDLAWSTDNTRLASTSEDCTVRIWNPADGCLQTLMRVDGQLSACAWTAAGDGLVVEGAHGLYGFDFHPGV